MKMRNLCIYIILAVGFSVHAERCGCLGSGSSAAQFQIGSCAQECNDRCISNRGTDNETDMAHSFFNPRQITTNNALQNNLSLYWWYHDVLCEDDCVWWALWVTPFYQRSMNPQKVATYFLPCQQSCISVKQDGTGSVGSLWLNLMAASGSEFDSVMSIGPKRSVVGAYLNFRFDMTRLLCHSWLEVAFAPMRAKHELNLCERNEVPGVKDGLETVCQALNQPDWLYGKFNNATLTRSGVDDIQIKFGYDWFYCDTDHISPYFVVVAPTGKPSSAVNIFEPTVGSCHTSLGIGFIGDICVWASGEQEITLLTDFKYRYALAATETRSFDLCYNGDWSRYLLVALEDDPSTPLPGINAFTQQFKVTPRSTIDWWIAAHWQKCQWNIELGYDLWWRAQERVRLCCFAQNIGVYNLAADGMPTQTTASKALICQSASGPNAVLPDDTFTKMRCRDINLNTASTPKALSNTLYAAFGYDGDFIRSPAVIGFGVSYEFGRNRAALNNCAVWFKAGLSF